MNVSAPDYNWTGFNDILSYVFSQKDYEHLFNDEDNAILKSYQDSSQEAQRLYIALYLRKHSWISSSKINYPNIGKDMQPYLRELTDAGLIITSDAINNLDEILAIMELQQLRELVRGLKGINIKNTGSASKPELLEAIIKHTTSHVSIVKFFGRPNSTGIRQSILKQAKKIVNSSQYRLLDKPWKFFSRAVFLYYPPQVNEDEHGKTLSYDFFIQTTRMNSGKHSYPAYTIRRTAVIYPTREDLIKYDEACQLEAKIMSMLEVKNVDYEKLFSSIRKEAEDGYMDFIHSPSFECAKSLPVYLRNATAGHVFLRCLTHLIGAYETKKLYQEAVDLCRILLDQDVFCLSYKGKFYERIQIDLERYLKKKDQAFYSLIQALGDPAVQEHQRFNLYTRAKKLSSSAKTVKWDSTPDDASYNFDNFRTVTITAPTLKKDLPGRRHIFLNEDGVTNCKVEDAAIQFYKREKNFTGALHTESSVFHALFMLLMWDVIYNDELEDTFRTKNQNLPLDFVHQDFYLRRKEMIDARLNELNEMSEVDVSVEILTSWKKHAFTYSLVDWSIDLEHLKEIAFCIGIKSLSAIFKRLCTNFRFNRSGFPDLILWNVLQRKVLSVEVKGPGDKLSPKQIMWLSYFTKHGLDCEVAYVKPKK